VRTKISGKIVAVETDHVTLEVGAFEYEVLIPDFVRRRLQGQLGNEVALHTIEYLEGNPAQGRLTPRLVGFQSIVERQFFEMFCSVDGVGAKKALRAMVRPVQDVALQIEQQDGKALATLPGIGAATAERIIAKLRRKMSRFALLVTEDVLTDEDTPRDVVRDAYESLLTLGHSDADARRLLDAVMAKKEKYKDTESLLHAVFRHTFEVREKA
jgi:holliday junction DNA helicase RuvA